MPSVERAFTIKQFAELFSGYPYAYGTAKGGWVHEPPTISVYAEHVEGHSGIGIGPLREDGTCLFAAIDIDRPDFELAKNLMALLPGTSWLERSRSGNAHVLVFFKQPIDAWVVRGILREALAAYGEKNVEVFPKSDFLYPGMVGNYLNLPYFGDTRPVIAWHDDEGLKEVLTEGATTVYIPENAEKPVPPSLSQTQPGLPVESFTRLASANRNDPTEWNKRAHWLGIPSPQEREAAQEREFGTSPQLHRCAHYIIEHRDDRPITEGHRAAVYFALAKMLSNWSEIDHDEALSMMALVNDASPDPIPSTELNRILFNAERGQFTSTGCDDPLVIEFSDPDCPIVRKA